jgi:hypothetical protein
MLRPTSRRCGNVSSPLVRCTSVGSLKVVSVRMPQPLNYCLRSECLKLTCSVGVTPAVMTRVR